MKTTVSHRHLREAIAKMFEALDEDPDEAINRIGAELAHSCLIIAGDVIGDGIAIRNIDVQGERYGLLFTDMDEFAKVFPDYDVGSHMHSIDVYLDMLADLDLDGFVINLKGECFILPAEGIEGFIGRPQNRYPSEDSYTSKELRKIRDSIDNSSLEDFIENPQNVGRYEELFAKMSASTILALRLTSRNLDGMAEDGMISLDEDKPVGFLHSERIGGRYATVFTSEERMASIDTPFNRYLQIVNFSQMTFFILSEDMDGIVINPGEENIVITRDVLLEFSSLLERTCNDSRLNSSVHHMFLMESEA